MKFRPWILVLPATLYLFLIDIAPTIFALWASFQKYILLSPLPIEFVAFENYKKLLNDVDFWQSFVRSLTFASLSTIVQLIIGMGVAFILYRDFKGKNIFRTILVLPLGVSPIAIGCMWKLMMNPLMGPVPWILKQLGFTFNYAAISWQAFGLLVLLDTWHWLPFTAIVLLSGLVSIPKDTIESSEVDGANVLQKLLHIQLPLITNEILLVTLMRFMGSFQIFDEVWMLTTGGPGHATRFLSILLYQTALLYSIDVGYGVTISLLYLFFIVIFSWILFKIIRSV